jgi:hypothetical protein
LSAGGLPPCCQACRARTGIVRGYTDPARWWCADIPGCNFRARRRLGIRRKEAVELWLTDFFAQNAPAIRAAVERDRDLDAVVAHFGLPPLTWSGLVEEQDL